MSRSKGRRGEQELARLYRAEGIDVKRTANSGGLDVKGDLIGAEGIHIEAKRVEKLPIWKSLEQTITDCPPDCMPALHFRRNSSPWWVAIPLHDFFDFIRPDTEET